MLLQALHHAGDRGVLLADRHVHADDALPLLVDDRVDRDRRLAGAAVADDQLALAATDRNHRVDRLDARLQRLLHRLALDDARRDDLHLAGLGRVNRAQPVHRPSQRVHHASHHGRPDGDLEHAGGAAHLVTLAKLEVVAEDHRPDVVFLEVERETGDLLPGLRHGELEHLPRHRGGEPVDPGDAVLHLQHGADFADVDVRQVGRLDFLQQDVFQLAGSEDGISRHGIALRRL